MFLLLGVSLASTAGPLGGNPIQPTPIGAGPRFHPPPGAREDAGLRCGPNAKRMGAHIELFARGRVVIVPAGIGVPRPFVREGAYVRPRGCTFPLRTLDPTGVVEIHAHRRLTLGHLFAVWGQALSRTRLAGFRTTAQRPVRAYVAGRRWRGPLRAVPLRRHAQIVLQLGRYIPPHRTFLFRPGL